MSYLLYCNGLCCIVLYCIALYRVVLCGIVGAVSVADLIVEFAERFDSIDDSSWRAVVGETVVGQKLLHCTQHSMNEWASEVSEVSG